MPDGPDTVMMQEDCREADGDVTIAPGIKQGANCRAAGEDVTKGRTILKSGLRLRPQEVGLAAAVGRAELQVFKKVRVAIFSTGDEVGEPGETGRRQDLRFEPLYHYVCIGTPRLRCR